MNRKGALSVFRDRQQLSLISSADLSDKKICTFSEEGFVDVPLPIVQGLCNGGNISLWHPEIALYRLENASVAPYSDTIFLGDCVLWDKVCQHTAKMEIPTDANIDGYGDHYLRSISLKSFSKRIFVDRAFTCFSAVNAHWSHFLFENLPRILSLRSFSLGRISLLLPETDDHQLKALIEHAAHGIDNVELVYIPRDTEVECKELFYCNVTSYLSNHAAYVHPSAVTIPYWTRNILKDFFLELSLQYNSHKDPKKVYIARSGAKRMNPYEQQIRSVFDQSDYVCIEPHLLSFKDKICLFANTTHIAGAHSSGFTNCFFSHGEVQLLEFVNYQRCLDTVKSQMNQVYPRMRISFVLPDTMKSANNDADFTIDLPTLKNSLLLSNFDPSVVKTILDTQHSKELLPSL